MTDQNDHALDAHPDLARGFDPSTSVGFPNPAPDLDALSTRLDDEADAHDPGVPWSLEDARDAGGTPRLIPGPTIDLSCLLIRPDEDLDRVVRAVYHTTGGVTPTELEQRLAIAKPRLHELLVELATYGLVREDPERAPLTWIHAPLAHEVVRRIMTRSTMPMAIAVTRDGQVLSVIDLAVVKPRNAFTEAMAARDEFRAAETMRDAIDRLPASAREVIRRDIRRRRAIERCEDPNVEVVDDATSEETRFARPFAIEVLRALELKIDEDTRDEWIRAISDVLVSHSRFVEQHRDEVVRPGDDE